MHKDVGRLAILLGCVALATSRLGLVAHELVGHGGTALALGGSIVAVKLFWFAGGWIRYTGASELGPALAVAMGGIAVELLAAAIVWRCSRGGTLGHRLRRGVAAALVVHAMFYLASGAWHGYGDGVVLYHVLGGARYPVAIAAGLVGCAAAFVGARGAFAAIAEALPPRRRVAGVIVAIALAGGVNAALDLGELAIRRDTTYTVTMTHERDRKIAADLARYRAEHPEASADEQTAAQQRIEREHRTFPFAVLLGVCTAFAALAGAWRARPGAYTPITRRQLALAAGTAAAGLALVIVLGAVL